MSNDYPQSLQIHEMPYRLNLIIFSSYLKSSFLGMNISHLSMVDSFLRLKESSLYPSLCFLGHLIYECLV